MKFGAGCKINNYKPWTEKHFITLSRVREKNGTAV
jgi:hypothetical protein